MTFVRTDGFFGGWGSAPAAAAPIPPTIPITYDRITGGIVGTLDGLTLLTADDPGDGSSVRLTGSATSGIHFDIDAADIVDENGVCEIWWEMTGGTAGLSWNMYVGLWDGTETGFPMACQQTTLTACRGLRLIATISAGDLTGTGFDTSVNFPRLNAGRTAMRFGDGSTERVAGSVIFGDASAPYGTQVGMDGTTRPRLITASSQDLASASSYTASARVPAGSPRLVFAVARTGLGAGSTSWRFAASNPLADGVGLYSP